MLTIYEDTSSSVLNAESLRERGGWPINTSPVKLLRCSLEPMLQRPIIYECSFSHQQPFACSADNPKLGKG